MEKLFVYGTLMDPKVQQEVLGRLASLHDDKLIDFEKSTIVINGNIYPIAVSKTGSSISGKVIEATPKEIILMDEYETDAYQRIKVTLDSGEMSWVYSQP
jgi:gamma-glutamylcyclotransferase (GGCT)/AIG2-like uncharacterized protein YtfP